ncbi:MAG: proton-conducting transporter membrane subunit [Candidatus Omnitrophota bacterium]
MNCPNTALLPFLVAIPLGAAFIITFAGKRIKGAGEAMATAAAFAGLLISIKMLFAPGAGASAIVCKVGSWAQPLGISLVADGLSVFMLVTVNLVAFIVSVYSIDYMGRYTDSWKFFALFSIMLAGINGVLVAGDIFNLYLFLEMAAISGYFLVAFGIDSDGLEASFKYAVMGSVASSFILMGIAFLYSYTSTLNMADMAGVLAVKGGGRVVDFVAVLFLMGFGLKGALVPFHSWLPYAHSSAPAPVSAMLSGVSIKVLGIYAIMRIFFNVFSMPPGISAILITLAVMSMVVASILAFGQTDIKRLFAYSSISQVGYIALGLGVATPLSVAAALFHLFNHSVFKSLLFLNSGSVERVTGTRDLSKMSGIISASPVVGYTNLAGSLSICGMPPLGGFWSKLLIILACIQARHPILALTAALVSILTLGYYFIAMTPALFGVDRGPAAKKISWSTACALIVLSIITVASGLILLPGAGRLVITNTAAVLTSGGSGYVNAIAGALK